MPIKHRTCLITGAAMGLGFEFAKLAAEDHYDLLLVDKNGEQLKTAKRSLEEKYPVSVKTFQADLSYPNVRELLESVVENHEIELLINNAGFGLYGKFEATDWKIEEQMLQLHILNLTFLTKNVLTQMLSHKSGKILNVSSMAAFQPGPYSSVYFASKAYIKSFSMAVANEIRGSGVTVTVMCPGQLNTGFADEVALRSHASKSKVSWVTGDVVKVAKTGYRGMQQGKIIIIPGLLNKMMASLSHLLPATFTASLNGRIQKKIRQN